MKAIVITLLNNPYSVRVANRCIESAKDVGIHVEVLPACDATLIDAPTVLESNGIPTKNFYDAWSRSEKAMACFFSHYSAWALSEAIKQPLLVLEHDAVFKTGVNLDKLEFDSILNIGKPSFGRFSNSKVNGIQPFFSNRAGYVKGAHAYVIKPEAASKMIDAAKATAGPADLFISTKNFPSLQELFPWPVEVIEGATTIQLERGAKSKHMYDKDYKII